MKGLLYLIVFCLVIISTGCGNPEVTASENTLNFCTDGVDNDEDGFYDCNDRGCLQFSFCSTTVQNGFAQTAETVVDANQPGLDTGVNSFNITEFPCNVYKITSYNFQEFKGEPIINKSGSLGMFEVVSGSAGKLGIANLRGVISEKEYAMTFGNNTLKLEYVNSRQSCLIDRFGNRSSCQPTSFSKDFLEYSVSFQKSTMFWEAMHETGGGWDGIRTIQLECDE